MGINELKEGPFEKIVNLFIPGSFALAPWVVLVFVSLNKDSQKFIENHEVYFGFVISLAVLAAGMILEDIGGMIEMCIDSRLDHPDLNDEIWRKYQRTAFKVEPIGHKYLRHMVLRMKFELAFMPSIPSFVIGLLVLYGNTTFVNDRVLLFILVILFALFILLWNAAKAGAKELAVIRYHLVNFGPISTFDSKNSDGVC